MSVLRELPCRCIRAAHCYRPGSRGHLIVSVGRRTFFVARCRYCRRKDDKL